MNTFLYGLNGTCLQLTRIINIEMVQWGVLLSLDRVVLMWSSLQFFFPVAKISYKDSLDLSDITLTLTILKGYNDLGKRWIILFALLSWWWSTKPNPQSQQKQIFTNFVLFFFLIFRNQNLQFLKKLSFHLLSLRLATPNVWSDIISPKMHVDLTYFV